MSKASQSKNLIEALSGYPLMKPKEIAAFLACSPDTAVRMLDQGVIPCVDLGLGKSHSYRADPIHVAVFLLAGNEGITPPEFWEKHGPEGTPECCMRLLKRIRKIQAPA